ncbi:hypothetical protein [Microcoleus sp. LAD1_D3]|uniref:hypothetical protein n=1 Tax=Microcoleus sp. LAD1_D3 TaxID=2819365 RepID=UPI002FD74CF3
MFPQKATNLTPQRHLWGEKYDNFAYDRTITTFAGDRIVVRQSCMVWCIDDRLNNFRFENSRLEVF